MVGELLTLPVRVGVRVTRLWFRAVEQTLTVASSATGRAIDLIGSRGSNGTVAEHRPDTAPPTPSRPSRTAAQPAARDHEPPSPPPGPSSSPPAEPVHVSEEPVLVQEYAEPGAEHGAGAEVHVDAPWDGYEQLNAKQVISRLAGASAAELAAVQLYESSHRRRQTILNAIERGLRSANGSGSRSQKGG